MNTKWSNNSNSVQVLSTNLVNSMKQLLMNMYEIKRKKICTKHENNRWMTSQILSKMRERDLKYEAALISNDHRNWDEFKQYRNDVVTMIISAKDNYFRKVLDKNKNNSQLLQKNLKTLIPMDVNNKLESIHFEELEVTDEAEIAEKFNFYFLNSIEMITSNIKPYHDFNYVIDNMKYVAEMNMFETIDMQYLNKIVKT